MMTMTTLMPTMIPTSQTSPISTQPMTYPAIKPDPSPLVMEEGTHHKTSPMSMPLPVATMAVTTSSQLTFIPMTPTTLPSFTLTQMITKPTPPSPCPYQWPLPTFPPLHLLGLQCHLQRLDNLQNILQQLYKQTNWLIAALVHVTTPITPMLSLSITKSPPPRCLINLSIHMQPHNCLSHQLLQNPA